MIVADTCTSIPLRTYHVHTASTACQHLSGFLSGCTELFEQLRQHCRTWSEYVVDRTQPSADPFLSLR